MSAATRITLIHAIGLGFAAGLVYLLVGTLLSPVPGTSIDDDELGGMWAVVAVVVVFRETAKGITGASGARLAATVLGILLCLGYVLVFPFSAVGLGVLITVGTIVATLVGRPQDANTTGITIAVVLIAAHIAGDETWRIPVLRLADTAIGVVVGAAVAWVVVRLSGRVAERAPADRAAARG